MAEDPPARTLAESLRARSDDELSALLRARPDLASPVPTDSAQLASRASTRSSVAQALERLNRFSLDVVDAVAVSVAFGDGVSTDAAAVRDLLGAADDAVDAELDRLGELALLWRSEGELHLVRTVREVLGPHPARLGPPAHQVFLAFSPGRLAQVTRDLGLEPDGDPVVNAEAVSALMRDDVRIQALLDALSPQARDALITAAAGPPTARLADARREVSVATARTPVEELLARGLLIPVESGTVIMPGEVGLALRGGILSDDPAAAPALEGRSYDLVAVDQATAAAALEVVQRVSDLLLGWLEAPPSILRSGGLGVRELRRTASTLDVEEPLAAFTVELAWSAGLLGPDGQLEEVWLPTVDFDDWRESPLAAQWSVLAAGWLRSTRVAGLVGTRDERDRVFGALAPDLDRPAAAQMRSLTLQVLAGLPAGTAPSPGAVLERVHWLWPRRASRLRDDLVAWTLREAEWLGLTGRGALSTPGRAVLEGADAAGALVPLLPAPLDHILLQADLTAVAPGRLELELERELSLLADVESKGGATVYRFSADSVRRALDAGRTASEVQQFLTTASRTPVPQPLSYLVDDVARRHGLIRVGGASSFLRCDDESLVSEIVADKRSGSLALRRLAPTVVASQALPAALLSRLREMGYAPAAEGSDGSVVVSRPSTRRAPARGRGSRTPSRSELSDLLLAATVRAVRAGDRTSAGQPVGASTGLGRRSPAQLVSTLREAVELGRSMWIGYVDNSGSTTERVVDPVRVEGGWLTAYDHRSDEVRSFAIHRISGVAAVPASG